MMMMMKTAWLPSAYMPLGSVNKARGAVKRSEGSLHSRSSLLIAHTGKALSSSQAMTQPAAVPGSGAFSNGLVRSHHLKENSFTV